MRQLHKVENRIEVPEKKRSSDELGERYELQMHGDFDC
jgi:hypothetical protein